MNGSTTSAAFLLAALTALAGGQSGALIEAKPPPLDAGAVEVHEACLRAERRDAYRRAFAEAGSRGRLRVAELWREWVAPPAPLHARPDAARLAALTRVLRGHAAWPESGETLQRSVDGIDLRLRPGWIVPRAEGEPRGQAITVGAFPAFAREHQETAMFQLFWLGPEGQEVRARQESVEAGAWTAGGLDFYVRAPLEARYGVWRLEPRLQHRLEVFRGTPVRVAVVPAAAGAVDAPPFDPLEVAALAEHGLRRFGLAGRLAGDHAAPPVTPSALAALGLHALSDASPAAREAVLLLPAADESWNELAFGAVGEAWAAALPENVALFALERAASWRAAVEGLHGAGTTALHVVAREDAGVAILSLRDAPELARLASLVVTTRARSERMPKPPPGVAGVWVEALASEELAAPVEGRDDWLLVRALEDPLGLDLALPGLFVDARAARRAGAGGSESEGR